MTLLLTLEWSIILQGKIFTFEVFLYFCQGLFNEESDFKNFLFFVTNLFFYFGQADDLVVFGI